jgi:hypothetical protein
MPDLRAILGSVGVPKYAFKKAYCGIYAGEGVSASSPFRFLRLREQVKQTVPSVGYYGGMASLSFAWSDLALAPDADGTTDVAATCTCTLTCSQNPKTLYLGVALYACATYYNSDGIKIDTGGNPLPQGQTWSKTSCIQTGTPSLGGTPRVVTITKTHGGATWVSSGKPSQAVYALYQYWAEASGSGNPPCTCSGSSVSSYGAWRRVDL